MQQKPRVSIVHEHPVARCHRKTQFSLTILLQCCCFQGNCPSSYWVTMVTSFPFHNVAGMEFRKQNIQCFKDWGTNPISQPWHSHKTIKSKVYSEF